MYLCYISALIVEVVCGVFVVCLWCVCGCVCDRDCGSFVVVIVVKFVFCCGVRLWCVCGVCGSFVVVVVVGLWAWFVVFLIPIVDTGKLPRGEG